MVDYVEAEERQSRSRSSGQLLSALSSAQRSITRARSIIAMTQWDFYGVCALGCGGNRATGHTPACSIREWLDHNSIIRLNGDSVS